MRVGAPPRQNKLPCVSLDAFSPQQKFDAVVGRLVLMYLPNPAATLRWLCRHVRRGSIVAFQEVALPLARSESALPMVLQ